MVQNSYVQQYQHNQIATASKEQILLLLYDGAIKFTRQARKGIQNGDFRLKGEGIVRAVNIVSELDATLDFETGGDIAVNLDALYHFIIRQLTQANLKNDEQALSQAETLLIDLRHTWEEAIAQIKKQQAPAAEELEEKGKNHGRLALNG